MSLPRTRSGGIHVHRDETAEELPEKNRNISGDLQPINTDPESVIPVPDQVRDDGSGTGVTGTEEPRIRPALIYSEKPERMQHGPRRLSAPSKFCDDPFEGFLCLSPACIPECRSLVVHPRDDTEDGGIRDDTGGEAGNSG